MATFWVHTNMGYCGTDESYEVEADSRDQAWEIAHQQCLDMISIDVCDSEEEADDCHI